MFCHLDGKVETWWTSSKHGDRSGKLTFTYWTAVMKHRIVWRGDEALNSYPVTFFSSKSASDSAASWRPGFKCPLSDKLESPLLDVTLHLNCVGIGVGRLLNRSLYWRRWWKLRIDHVISLREHSALSPTCSVTRTLGAGLCFCILMQSIYFNTSLQLKLEGKGWGYGVAR